MRAPVAALAVALLVLAACGTDDPPVEDLVTDADMSTSEGDSGVEVSGSPDEKPQVTIPDGEPPAGLVTEDLVTGDGPEAAPGATVTAHYVGVSWSTSEQFDASWDRGEPIAFPLSGVIPGWQEGIPGMRVGGRRLLVIPPDMAYRDQPPPGSGIAPGETLVFVVDLVSVQ